MESIYAYIFVRQGAAQPLMLFQQKCIWNDREIHGNEISFQPYSFRWFIVCSWSCLFSYPNF